VTFAETNLAAIEAAIAGTLTRGMASYQLAGRAITSFSLTELMDFRDRLRNEVATEQARDTGVSSVKNILARFT